MIKLDVHSDHRGSLIALEKAQGLPFELKRVFCIFDVPPGLERGNHAVSADMVLIAVNGALTLTCDNGVKTTKFRLEKRDEGVHVKPGVLISLSDFAPGAILMVASSKPYAATEYFNRPVFVCDRPS